MEMNQINESVKNGLVPTFSVSPWMYFLVPGTKRGIKNNERCEILVSKECIATCKTFFFFVCSSTIMVKLKKINNYDYSKEHFFLHKNNGEFLNCFLSVISCPTNIMIYKYIICCKCVIVSGIPSGQFFILISKPTEAFLISANRLIPCSSGIGLSSVTDCKWC